MGLFYSSGLLCYVTGCPRVACKILDWSLTSGVLASTGIAGSELQSQVDMRHGFIEERLFTVLLAGSPCPCSHQPLPHWQRNKLTPSGFESVFMDVCVHGCVSNTLAITLCVCVCVSVCLCVCVCLSVCHTHIRLCVLHVHGWAVSMFLVLKL